MHDMLSHPAAKTVQFRARSFTAEPRQWLSWGSFVVVIALWQAASSAGLVNSLFLPSPLHISQALHTMLVSGELAEHFGASLARISAGWLLGAAFGMALGMVIGLSGIGRSIGLPFISALFPIPKIALLPLLILWLGIGEPSKVATIALGVFFPMAISTYAGVDSVPHNLIRMAQSFNLPLLAIVRKIIVPGMLPSVLAGCRITASLALVLVAAAEMIGANTGIGALVLTAGNLMQTDKLMAGIVAISILGLLIGALITWLERSLLAWRS